MDAATTEISSTNDHIITAPDIAIEPTESIGSYMFNNMKKHKDKLAQIEVKTDERITYGELLQRSIRTALHMADKKITRKDVITLCTKNHINAVVPYIAAQFLGAVMANIDPSFSYEEMIHLLNTVRPKILFTVPEAIPVLERVIKDISLPCELVVFGETNKHTAFFDFLNPHHKEDTFEPIKIDNCKDTALIYFSSGTTGLPKGICINHYAFVGQIINRKYSHNPDMEYMGSIVKRVSYPITHLGYTALYWLSAGAMLLGCIGDGFCRLMCEDFNGKEFWDITEKYKPIFIMLTPIQAIEILANRRIDVDVKSVLQISIIGSSISKDYLLKMKDAFPDTTVGGGYGQTEICGPITLFRPHEKLHREIRKDPRKIESVGLPVRGNLYKVVDVETNKNLGPNQKGELRIKSKFIMNGYYNVDSSDTFDEDGWLKTGDMVYYDEDFCFYVVDRIKEAFKYQGWFIAPVVLENELTNHPAVKLAVVIGIPKDDGHHPMGLVILNDGYQVTEEEIEKFVEKRVPERQRLRAGVKFIKTIPLTVTGKIKRRELKKMVLDGKI